MRTEKLQSRIPGIAACTRYYEHDGMLRAYANRAMLLAIIFAGIAVGSVGFAIYTRVQPPTVIRVDKDGNAVLVGERQQNRVTQLAVALARAGRPDADSSAEAAPSDL